MITPAAVLMMPKTTETYCMIGVSWRALSKGRYTHKRCSASGCLGNQLVRQLRDPVNRVLEGVLEDDYADEHRYDSCSVGCCRYGQEPDTVRKS